MTVKNKKSSAKKPTVQRRIHHKARLAVVPHEANDFRPHLVRSYGVFGMIAIAFFAVAVSNFPLAGSILGTKANVTATELLQETNDERAALNVEPLRYDEQLSSAAYLKAKDMFAKQYWAHVAPDGTTPWQWFGEVDYNYTYAGENLAKNFTSTKSIITAWMTSEHHRDNIVNQNYRDVGFAVVDGTFDGKPTTLIVALYGSKATEVAGASAKTVAIAGEGNVGIIGRIGIAVQSMTPTELGSVVLLIIGAFVALVAHAYRRRMPVAVRKSWRYHHGLFKAIGLGALVVVFIALYSGGQI